MSARRAVSVVGIGDDGCAGLCSRAVNAVLRASVLCGGERQLAFFPQFQGERVVLKTGLGAAIERIAELCEDRNVCILASGDPLFFGIGSLIVRKLGAGNVELIPQPSSVQLAFARVGIPWDDATVISLHGRPLFGLLTRLRRLAKVAVLTDDESSPARIAAHLLEHDQGSAWSAHVCERLGGPDERVRPFSVQLLAEARDIDPLNVLLLQRTDAAWRPPPAIPFLHEDAFAKRMPKKGLITKREVRALSLAALAIRPDSVVWDIGAGSGSVAIEAALLAPNGRAIAIEVDPDGVAICRENLRVHAIDNVELLLGRAPEALANLAAPDAVFIGGSKGSMAEILDVVLARLQPGGRVVANAITLENAAEIYQCLRAHGLRPEVTLLQVSRAEPLAHYMRYEALNPIQIFAAEKPGAGSAEGAGS